MNWLIEIFHDDGGRPAASAPTITAQVFDEVTWFVQGSSLQRFQVELELIDTTFGLGQVPDPGQPGQDGPDEGPGRQVRRILDSHHVEAVRLRIPLQYSGRRAGYRILSDAGGPGAEGEYTGIITIAHAAYAMSGRPVEPTGRHFA